MGKPTKFSLKLIKTIETMKQKKLSLLALSETQWVGKGIVELEDTTAIFSGIDEKRGGNKRGVAKALRGVMREAWKKEGTYTMI